MRAVIDQLSDGEFCYEMDNGARIAVKVSIDRENREATIDFTGTSEQLQSNFNAPEPVCYAAVLYTFRILVDSEIPMTAGCMKPLKVIIPDGCMLSPRYPAAVVAGNVETSSVIVDAILGALQRMSASQGTMNNFTFGDESWQYYETVCGGAGAGPTFHGASAVQTHMTNSRLTDPEILETRFPVVLMSFCVREGSGGRGKFNGGDGTERRVMFLKDMQANILSNHRKIAPFGLCGGGDGKVGRNSLIRHNGETVELAATALVRVEKGDVFCIETPGGGGYGAPE